jgi:hypothetical protein
MINIIKLVVKSVLPFYGQFNRLTKSKIPFSYKDFVFFQIVW